MVSSSPFSRHVANLTPFSRTSPPSSPLRLLHLQLHHQQLSLSPISTIVHLPRNTRQLHRTSLSCGFAAVIPNCSSDRIIHRNHVLGSVLASQTRLAKGHQGLNRDHPPHTVSAAVVSTKSHCHDHDALKIGQSFLNSREAMQTHVAFLIKDQFKCRLHLSERSIEASPAHSRLDHGRAKIPIKGKLSLSGQRRSIGVAGPNFREKLRRFLAVRNGHISGLEYRIQTLESENGETLLGLRRFKRKYSHIKRQLQCEMFRLKVERSLILLLLLFL